MPTRRHGRARATPGTKGQGRYYRVVVRPKEDFTAFRYHDVGRAGHIVRLAGRRSSGSWDTQAWLIGKDDAHRAGNRLVAETSTAKSVLTDLGSRPTHLKGDVFRARPRKVQVARRRAS